MALGGWPLVGQGLAAAGMAQGMRKEVAAGLSPPVTLHTFWSPSLCSGVAAWLPGGLPLGVLLLPAAGAGGGGGGEGAASQSRPHTINSTPLKIWIKPGFV